MKLCWIALLSLGLATFFGIAILSNTNISESIDQEKPIYYFFHSANCPGCRIMEEEVLIDERVQVVLESDFVFVRADTSWDRGLVRKYRVYGVPANVFTKPDGTEIARIVGIIGSPDELLEILNRVLSFAKA
jgi:thioredoxin-related protein